MLNVGTPELLVILLVALLVLGPTKLPDAARKMGRAMSEITRLQSGFQREMRDALRVADEETDDTTNGTRPREGAGQGDTAAD